MLNRKKPRALLFGAAIFLLAPAAARADADRCPYDPNRGAGQAGIELGESTGEHVSMLYRLFLREARPACLIKIVEATRDGLAGTIKGHADNASEQSSLKKIKETISLHGKELNHADALKKEAEKVALNLRVIEKLVRGVKVDKDNFRSAMRFLREQDQKAGYWWEERYQKARMRFGGAIDEISKYANVLEKVARGVQNLAFKGIGAAVWFYTGGNKWAACLAESTARVLAKTAGEYIISEANHVTVGGVVWTTLLEVLERCVTGYDIGGLGEDITKILQFVSDQVFGEIEGWLQLKRFRGGESAGKKWAEKARNWWKERREKIKTYIGKASIILPNELVDFLTNDGGEEFVVAFFSRLALDEKAFFAAIGTVRTWRRALTILANAVRDATLVTPIRVLLDRLWDSLRENVDIEGAKKSVIEKIEGSKLLPPGIKEKTKKIVFGLGATAASFLEKARECNDHLTSLSAASFEKLFGCLFKAIPGAAIEGVTAVAVKDLVEELGQAAKNGSEEIIRKVAAKLAGSLGHFVTLWKHLFNTELPREISRVFLKVAEGAPHFLFNKYSVCAKPLAKIGSSDMNSVLKETLLCLRDQSLLALEDLVRTAVVALADAAGGAGHELAKKIGEAFDLVKLVVPDAIPEEVANTFRASSTEFAKEQLGSFASGLKTKCAKIVRNEKESFLKFAHDVGRCVAETAGATVKSSGIALLQAIQGAFLAYVHDAIQNWGKSGDGETVAQKIVGFFSSFVKKVNAAAIFPSVNEIKKALMSGAKTFLVETEGCIGDVAAVVDSAAHQLREFKLSLKTIPKKVVEAFNGFVDCMKGAVVFAVQEIEIDAVALALKKAKSFFEAFKDDSSGALETAFKLINEITAKVKLKLVDIPGEALVKQALKGGAEQFGKHGATCFADALSRTADIKDKRARGLVAKTGLRDQLRPIFEGLGPCLRMATTTGLAHVVASGLQGAMKTLGDAMTAARKAILQAKETKGALADAAEKIATALGNARGAIAKKIPEVNTVPLPTKEQLIGAFSKGASGFLDRMEGCRIVGMMSPWIVLQVSNPESVSAVKDLVVGEVKKFATCAADAVKNAAGDVLSASIDALMQGIAELKQQLMGRKEEAKRRLAGVIIGKLAELVSMVADTGKQIFAIEIKLPDFPMSGIVHETLVWGVEDLVGKIGACAKPVATAAIGIASLDAAKRDTAKGKAKVALQQLPKCVEGAFSNILARAAAAVWDKLSKLWQSIEDRVVYYLTHPGEALEEFARITNLPGVPNLKKVLTLIKSGLAGVVLKAVGCAGKTLLNAVISETTIKKKNSKKKKLLDDFLGCVLDLEKKKPGAK